MFWTFVRTTTLYVAIHRTLCGFRNFCVFGRVYRYALKYYIYCIQADTAMVNNFGINKKQT